MLVGDNLAGIAGGSQHLPHQLGERDPLRSRGLDEGVDGLGNGGIGNGGRDVLGRDRLQVRSGHDDGVAVGRRIRDSGQELEELSGPDDGVRHRRRLDQLLLSKLGAHVAAVRYAVGTDDGQGDVVPDAGCGFSGQQVASGGLEELQYSRILERWRIGHIDDLVGAGKSGVKALAGDGVHSRSR
jgi:hypothetical protein